MEALLVLMQWPAMAVTVAASWLVASRHQSRRRAAFWLFLCSNVLWVAWGLHSGAMALVALQFCLVGMNLRGASKTAGNTAAEPGDERPRTG